MRLAARVGTADVDALLDSLTPAQFAEWRAFDSIEPLGLEKLYRIIALLGVALCRAQGLEAELNWFLTDETPGEKEDDIVTPNQAAALLRSAIQQRHPSP